MRSARWAGSPARLRLGERPQRYVGHQAAPVAPAHGVQAPLPGQGEDQAGGQLAVPPGDQQVREPPVQEGRGALVRVQEQHDPRHRVRDPPQLGYEDRRQHPYGLRQ
ncbi:hypothetical protein [Streptomyces sp. B27]|uniref:hypothetical protein n=1 Tax=Streptomyces TaxID=1883 RepID=UPI000FDB9A12|nr:hypothetical protein [Streptomyces sp. B27]